jgi:predicted chitinase
VPPAKPNNALLTAILYSVPQRFQTAAQEAVPLLLNACKEFGISDLAEISYILATVQHESFFKPIREIRASAVKNPKIYALQNRYWGTGFYGRGYVQLTWKSNYEAVGHSLNVDLVTDPDMALVHNVAARICVYGMRYGVFTGRKLSDFHRPSGYDFKLARSIINGTDKDDEIAVIAQGYFKNLTSRAPF